MYYTKSIKGTYKLINGGKISKQSNTYFLLTRFTKKIVFNYCYVISSIVLKFLNEDIIQI